MQLGLAPNPQREGRAYALVVQIMAVEKGNFRAQAHILCKITFARHTCAASLCAGSTFHTLRA